MAILAWLRWVLMMQVMSCAVVYVDSSNSEVFLENGTYTASATDFGQDCAVTCNDDAIEVPYNYTLQLTYAELVLKQYGTSTLIQNAIDDLSGTWEGDQLQQLQNFTWSGKQCVYCAPLTDIVKNTTIPKDKYIMDASCQPTCYNHFHYYNRPTYPKQCVKCMLSDCSQGQVLTGDKCNNCIACVQTTEHWEFTGHGTILDDNTSCPGQCKDGYFEDVRYNAGTDSLATVCTPHQELNCSANEFLVRGTHISDAFCDACGECEGMNMTQPCSAESNAVCEFCLPTILEMGAYYVHDNCTKLCMSGFVEDKAKLLCEECLHTCDAGHYFPKDRQNCTHCVVCNVTKPEYSDFVRECEWSCNDGYYLEGQECHLLQSLIPTHTDAYSSVLCEVGQQLDCNALTRTCTCLNCTDVTNIVHPTVEKLGESWHWLPTRSQCAWECLPEYYIVPLSSRVVDCYAWDWFQAQLNLKATVVETTDSIQTLRRKREEPFVPLSELLLFLVTAVTTISFLICVQK